MTCREFTEFLDAYLAGDLAPDEAREFDRHLRVCEACVRYLDSYRKTIEMGRRAYADAPPEEAPEDLIRAILAAHGNE